MAAQELRDGVAVVAIEHARKDESARRDRGGEHRWLTFPSRPPLPLHSHAPLVTSCSGRHADAVLLRRIPTPTDRHCATDDDAETRIRSFAVYARCPTSGIFGLTEKADAKGRLIWRKEELLHLGVLEPAWLAEKCSSVSLFYPYAPLSLSRVHQRVNMHP